MEQVGVAERQVKKELREHPEDLIILVIGYIPLQVGLVILLYSK